MLRRRACASLIKRPIRDHGADCGPVEHASDCGMTTCGGAHCRRASVEILNLCGMVQKVKCRMDQKVPVGRARSCAVVRVRDADDSHTPMRFEGDCPAGVR